MRAAYDADYGPYLGHPLDPRSEDGPTPCEDCRGTGKTIDTSDGEPVEVECGTCRGMKHIDEAGVPVRLNCWGDRDYGRGFAA